ncbi:betaine/proline/choline family ABC transporter ATP-binding protein [Arthrobacter sp. CDRTa11]|uniref:quaternary amine ABC transporter ATP-binding protein n=1 Tax=Arthrobacter sp. CDRTa11 TaxID=2651199 RepID=UPI002B4000A4|nr:betaine/proline/choline family ABC transporter ATP-binding protein [Arthrobacter sp. CDRTa11]
MHLNAPTYGEQAMKPEEPFIKVEHLTKIFHPAKKRSLGLPGRKNGPPGFVAVDDVSFQVEQGQIFVIMGLSGSGKSTIIRMLNRLIDASDGSISVDGKDVRSLPPAELRDYRNRTINMVFQHFGLFPHKSLVHNVDFGLKVRGMDRETREQRAAEALELVGLGDRIHAMPDQLSGGMKQRVGLARALATDAEILLMDEPFSALDPLIRKDMQELLIKLQRNFKKTIVFVTHDLNEAMYLGDRIMVMKQGKIVQSGTALDLLEAPADPYIEKFVAEVDRSKVLTAGMLAEHHDPSPASRTSSGSFPDGAMPVSDTTFLNDLLPIFATGAGSVNVVNQQGSSLGHVTAEKVFEALSPKGFSNAS